MELGAPSTLDVQAVQERTVLDDPITHSVLQIIKNFMGSNGEPACLSLRTIAARAGCHYNTAAHRIKTLCANGDLIVTNKGKRVFYSIP